MRRPPAPVPIATAVVAAALGPTLAPVLEALADLVAARLAPQLAAGRGGPAPPASADGYLPLQDALGAVSAGAARARMRRDPSLRKICIKRGRNWYVRAADLEIWRRGEAP